MATRNLRDDQRLPWQSHVGQTVVERLQERRDDLKEWLAEHAPDCDHAQTHLDAGTPERVYWHYGYAVALRDVLALLTRSASTLKH